MSATPDWFTTFRGRKSDRMTVLNCPSIQCHNGSTTHTITVAHGLRSYTCTKCGSVKRADEREVKP